MYNKRITKGECGLPEFKIDRHLANESELKELAVKKKEKELEWQSWILALTLIILI